MSDDGELGDGDDAHNHDDEELFNIADPGSHIGEPDGFGDDPETGATDDRFDGHPDDDLNPAGDADVSLPAYDVTLDDVELPNVVEDPIWADGGGEDVAAAFGGASVNDLLGRFDETFAGPAPGAVDEFHAAVQAERGELDGLEAVDGYVTPSSLGEPE